MNDRLVTFTNATPVPWVASVWQELPGGGGLTAVSWQQGPALPGKTIPLGWTDSYAVALATFEEVVPSGIFHLESCWTDSYAVALATFEEPVPNGIFHLESFVATKRDWTWDVITIGGRDYLADAGEGPEPGSIRITNRSAGPVNAGLMQSGAAVAYAKDLPVDGIASFGYDPRFRFGLFVDLQRGQVIDPKLIAVGPAALPFSDVVTHVLVTAALQGQSIVLTIVPA
jgi:hypothetical protein